MHFNAGLLQFRRTTNGFMAVWQITKVRRQIFSWYFTNVTSLTLTFILLFWCWHVWPIFFFKSKSIKIVDLSLTAHYSNHIIQGKRVHMPNVPDLLNRSPGYQQPSVGSPFTLAAHPPSSPGYLSSPGCYQSQSSLAMEHFPPPPAMFSPNSPYKKGRRFRRNLHTISRITLGEGGGGALLWSELIWVWSWWIVCWILNDFYLFVIF